MIIMIFTISQVITIIVMSQRLLSSNESYYQLYDYIIM